MRWDWIGWDEGVLLFFGWNEIEMRWYWEVWYGIGNCEDEKILDWGLGVNPNPSGWDEIMGQNENNIGIIFKNTIWSINSNCSN